MSIVRTFLENRDQPIQVHLDRTVTQYHQSGPMQEPCVLMSGDPDHATSRAGRVLSGGLESMLAQYVDSDLTPFLDFEVTNAMAERMVTALYDASGHVEKVENGVITIRSRTMRGNGFRMYVPTPKVLFFYASTPVDAGPGIDVDDPNAILEVRMEHKGRLGYAYVPASSVLFILTPMAIALV